QPNSPMSLHIESMSLSRGTPLRVVFPSASRHAAMIGSALFLLPLISIRPLSRVPPRMRRESIAARPWVGDANPSPDRLLLTRNVGAAKTRRPEPFGLSAGPSAETPIALWRRSLPGLWVDRSDDPVTHNPTSLCRPPGRFQARPPEWVPMCA